ncbi:MAG TPA: class I SAM-dependent RNA methyltransferase [Desulfuromonadaceae bacterium]
MTAPFQVSIESLAFGGSGVGRIDGKVCFVPFSCPGDEVRVRVVSEKRSYLTARIEEIVAPSPHRVAPPCPLFGSCGGCSWQHIDYPRQVEAKRLILSEAMWRGARVPADLVAETVASPLRFGYRSRVQFKLHAGAGGLHIGFYRQGSHFVEDAPRGCPVALGLVNDALRRLREVLATFPEPAAIPQINIDCAEQGAVGIVNYIGRNPEGAAAFFDRHAQALKPLTGLYLQTGRKSTLARVWGDGRLVYTLPTGSGTCELGFRPGGFSQVNGSQNRALLERIRDLAGFRGEERLLDLYCGNGNFSLPLAGEVGAVTGVEEYGDSIAAARDNCCRNGITNAEFIVADAGGAVRRFAAEGRRYEVVILDPPRSGAAETVRELRHLKPERIIYISCDPSTLARDCGLLAADGYRVVTAVPVDMFPQTYHVENIALLQRQG